VLLINSLAAADDDECDDGNATNDCFGHSNDSPAPPVVQTFLSIINNDHDSSTEGHRETSAEILKGLFHRAFGRTDDGNNDDTPNQNYAMQQEQQLLQQTLIKMFQTCSQTFQKRMTRCELSNKGSFHHGATTMEPMESSEHIRLLLVEIMLDLGEYCLTSCRKDCGERDETNSKVIIGATSGICTTLAKSTLLDQYPEVQRAACNLVVILAGLCPLAVRMNATGLLVPLTGRMDDAFGNVEQSSASLTASISKKCLFRHRHAKTRCKAVDASAAIVMCCPRGDSASDNGCQDANAIDSGVQQSMITADHLSGYGSNSSSMEQILQDTLLPGWEDLLKMDSSASVQTAVLKSLGNVASMLDWRYSPTLSVSESTTSATDAQHHPANTSKMDLASMVEARLLSLFLMGMSAGSVNQVRSMAVQQLTSIRSGNGKSDIATNGQNLPLDVLMAYFHPMLELILHACSQDWALCQSKVRSLEALQVILSIAIPLMNSNTSSTSGAKVELSNGMIRSIMDILSKNILSEDKEVLEAALASCRIIGANNHGTKALIEIVSMQSCNDGSGRSALSTDDADSIEELQSNISAMTIESFPRQMTSLLLILDGMMKGSLCNIDATSILLEIDPKLDIPAPDWFQSSPDSVAAISSSLCHPTITNNVATNSSLAWALLDACDSFAGCAHQLSLGCDEQLEMKEDVVINVLISIAYLLSCPEEYGISSNATKVLDAFSSLQSTSDSNVNEVMDVHFRRVLPKITASAPPFPWKQSDPAFLAMDALLRACSGSMVGSNFDMVAPFFISHLSTAAYTKNVSDGDDAHDQSLRAAPAKDEIAEEYSQRISLMALLQTILSDESFSQTLYPQQSENSPATSALSAQFTTDVLLSLVLPNLVWKAGGMASALRKLAAATLFSLLSHCHNEGQAQHQQNEKRSALLHPETTARLIPILHSNLEDIESTTRELSCVCLSLVLEQVSSETFSAIWKQNTQAIDSLYPRLLELLDDSHDPVRMAACSTLEQFLQLAHSAASKSSFNLEFSSLENITSSLLIQLDDPNHEIQDHVFQVLSSLLELQYQEYTTKCRDKNKRVVEMIERQINTSTKSHRDDFYCRLLLEKIDEYHKWKKKEGSLKV